MYGEFIGVCSYNIQVSKITILFINKMGNGGYWNGEFIGVWSFNIQVSKITILFINRMGNGCIGMVSLLEFGVLTLR